LNETFQPEDRALLNQVGSLLLIRWRDGVVKPPAGSAFGTHLVSLLLCPTGNQFKTMQIAWVYKSPSGQIFRTGQPFDGMNSYWYFEDHTFKKFEFEPLQHSDSIFLELEELHADLMAAYSKTLDKRVLALRDCLELDPFRNHGFPDDVLVTLGPDQKIRESQLTILGEQVWVRLLDQDAEGIFLGELLNQPVRNPSNKGDRIHFRLIGEGSRSVLCVVKPPAPLKGSNEMDYVQFVRVIFRDFFQINSPDSFRARLPDNAVLVPPSGPPGQPSATMLPPMRDFKFDADFAGGLPGTVECSFDQCNGQLLVLRLAVFFESEEERNRKYQELKSGFVDSLDVEVVNQHHLIPVEALQTEKLTIGVNHKSKDPLLSVWIMVRSEWIPIVAGNN
jgi:hypothetical protein